MASANKAGVVRWVYGLFLLLAVYVPQSLGNGGSCVELGFTSSLLCSSCQELRQFDLEVLEEQCKTCCQSEGVASEEKVWPICLCVITVAIQLCEPCSLFNAHLFCLKFRGMPVPYWKCVDENWVGIHTSKVKNVALKLITGH